MKQFLHLIHPLTVFRDRVLSYRCTHAMWLLVMFLSFYQLEVVAQKAPGGGILGTVIDEESVPIIGATVVIRGTTIGTTTDASGKFSFPTSTYKPNPADVIQVSYIGMVTEELAVANRSTFQFTLKEDAQTIENVVVTGFQTISKTNFTGSASKIKTENLNVKGASDISRMLEGSIAGVSIQNVSGTFGAAPKVRVRGVTSINGVNKPLWVIDGVIHEDIVNVSNDELTSGDPTTLLGSAVAGLNANDIESIDVLKDASATALYGARAMNGVVVVTTKRGKSGRPIVTYSGNFTVQLKPSYDNYDIMNSWNQVSIYAELERKGWLNSDIVNASNSGIYGNMYKRINTFNESTGEFLLENTTAAKRGYLSRFANANTDWFDTLFRTSLTQEHSVSISAGSEKSSTYASLSLLNDGGWTIADHVTRYTANLRSDYQISKRVNVGVQVVGSVRRQTAPGSLSRRSNTVEGSYDRDFDINPFSYALNTSRALTAFDEQGNLEYFTRNFAPFNIINELDNNSITLNMIDLKAQAELGVVLAKGLKFEFTGAARYVKSDREHEIKERANMAEAYRADYTSTIRSKNKYLYKDPDRPNDEAISVLPFGGFYNKTEDMLMNYDIRNSLKYNHEFDGGRHTINALAGQQIKFADRQQFNNTGYGYQYDQGGIPSVDYRILKKMVESNFPYYEMGKTRSRFAAFYANVDYSFDKRYVAAATIRYDGSNALGQNAKSRWLPTWNFSGKWNIHNEHFIEKATWIDQLSIRASYGLTADMPPSASASAVYRTNNTNRPYAGEIESAINIESLQNDNLTWEKGYLTNIGLDLGLFNRRLDIVFDYWWRNSFDLISSIKTSGIGGQLWKLANYADMKSSGFDLSVAGYPVRGKSFSWYSNFTFGYNTTKITNAKYQPNIYGMCGPDGGNLEGYPVKSLFSIQYVSTNQNGVPSFIDESGKTSHKVYFQSTSLDYLKYEGTIDPKYTGGWSNTFKYKSLSLNVFLTFQGGNKIRMAPAFKSNYTDLDAMPQKFFDRWVMAGDEQYTTVPSMIDALLQTELSGSYPYNAYNYSDTRVADGGFLRLKTVSLAYTLPKKWLQRSGFINNVTLTCAASNMWLIYADKRLNGQDPEFYNSGGVAQPLAKQITFAVNVSF